MEHLNILYVFFTFCIGFFSIIILTIIYFKTKNKFLSHFLFAYFIYTLLVMAICLDLYLIINFQNNIKTTRLIIRIIYISSLYFLPSAIIFMIHYIFKIKYRLLLNILFIVISIFSILSVLFTHKMELTEVKFYFSSYLNISFIVFIILILYMLLLCFFNYEKVEDKEIKKITKHAMILLILFLPGLINDFFNFLDLPSGIYFFPIHYCCLSILITTYIIRNYFNEFQLPQNIIKQLDENLLSEFMISPREKEIFLLIIDGYGNKKIADKLFISISTVKKHIYSIFKKTNVSSRYELLRILKNKVK